nr:hypothetical protein [Tanacetum cinerariifolium]
MDNTNEPPVVKANPNDWCYVELDYNMEECYKALTDQLDWNNPEGDRYPFGLSIPLPLVQSRNCQIVPVDYFFNNDLAYLQKGRTNITYMTSLTKKKAAKYNLPRIEDMVPNLWSPIKAAYEKHALLGTTHEEPKRQRFYGYASKRVSKHDVYSTKRILAMKNVKVNEWYGYGHLKEIKNRLFNLKDKLERNRLICSHKLYKFSEGTLISVHDTFKDMANNLEMGYTSVMLRRRWSNLDKKLSCIIVKDIDCQLLKRRLMKSLEKYVGGREYEEDLRLL